MKRIISEIEIIPIKPQNGILAFSSFVLDGDIYLGSIAIMSRPNGSYRLTYPSKKIGQKNIPIFHPITKEFGHLIEQEILRKYEKITNQNERYVGKDEQ